MRCPRQFLWTKKYRSLTLYWRGSNKTRIWRWFLDNFHSYNTWFGPLSYPDKASIVTPHLSRLDFYILSCKFMFSISHIMNWLTALLFFCRFHLKKKYRFFARTRNCTYFRILGPCTFQSTLPSLPTKISRSFQQCYRQGDYLLIIFRSGFGTLQDLLSEIVLMMGYSIC